jgi:hypothetical protein
MTTPKLELKQDRDRGGEKRDRRRIDRLADWVTLAPWLEGWKSSAITSGMCGGSLSTPVASVKANAACLGFDACWAKPGRRQPLSEGS